ncbi:MAG: lysozyme inhibitor LprI family protein, partial [Pontixanthobacter sp.]
RDAHCRSEGYYAYGGSLEPLLVSSCKAQLTRQRTDQLVELVEQ